MLFFCAAGVASARFFFLSLSVFLFFYFYFIEPLRWLAAARVY